MPPACAAAIPQSTPGNSVCPSPAATHTPMNRLRSSQPGESGDSIEFIAPASRLIPELLHPNNQASLEDLPMQSHRLLLLAALLLLLPGRAFPHSEKITTDYDHAATFSTYRTYAWTEGTSAKDSLLDQSIRDAVDQQLSARGYHRLVDPNRADVLVSYDVAVGQSSQLNPAGMGTWAWGWGNGGRLVAADVEAQSLPAGTLAIRIGDNRTHRIVWRGAASGVLNVAAPPPQPSRMVGNSLRESSQSLVTQPERSSPQVQHCIGKMFSRYPPQS